MGDVSTLSDINTPILSAGRMRVFQALLSEFPRRSSRIGERQVDHRRISLNGLELKGNLIQNKQAAEW
jgi:hypothetical protein